MREARGRARVHHVRDGGGHGGSPGKRDFRRARRESGGSPAARCRIDGGGGSMQFLIVLLLVVIVGSLGHALFSISSGPDRAQQIAQALTLRIPVSVALFVLLLVGYHFGWIETRGIRWLDRERSWAG